MTNREINKAKMAFLKGELEVWKTEGLISDAQHDGILQQYSVKSLSFIRVVLVIGALLVGLGILSFIASNWDAMSKTARFLTIIGLYTGVNAAGYRALEKYPKTGRSLIYIGCLVYGAGIFLVGQIFHLGGHFQDAFLLWGLGLLPMAWLYRDLIVYLFSQLLLLVFILGSMEPAGWNLLVLLVPPGLFLLNTRMDHSRAGSFFNTLVLFSAVGYVLNRLDVSGLVAAAVFMALGAFLHLYPLPVNREIFRLEGGLCFGIAGLFLTSRDLWGHYSAFGDGSTASILFAILFVLALLSQVRIGSLVALVFVCATILRFYFDTFFDFMPKSVFFILGGLILLGFGFYFERLRSRKGGVPHA